MTGSPLLDAASAARWMVDAAWVLFWPLLSGAVFLALLVWERAGLGGGARITQWRERAECWSKGVWCKLGGTLPTPAPPRDDLGNAPAPARNWFGRHFRRAPADRDVRRVWLVVAPGLAFAGLLLVPTDAEAVVPILAWGVKALVVAAVAQVGGMIYDAYHAFKSITTGTDGALVAMLVELLAQLQAVRDGFGKVAYTELGKSLRGIFAVLSVIFILITFGKALIFPDSGREALAKVIGRIPLIMIVSFLLGKTGLVIYEEYVIDVIEGLGLHVGSLFIAIGHVLPQLVGHAALTPPPEPPSGMSYAYLAHIMATSMADVLDIAFLMMTASVREALMGGAFAGLILLLPYSFVIGIFIGFLVEAMFKILAMWVISPLLLCLTLFDATKGFWVASLRVLMSAGLTVAFVSAAMGLTLGVVETNRARIVCDVVGQEHAKCVALLQGKPTTGGLSEADTKRVREEGNTGLKAGSSAYFYTLILGLVSVLLHLKAAALASNISGAQDSAGAAAAVTMAGQGALGILSRGAMKLATAGTGWGRDLFKPKDKETSADLDEQLKALLLKRLSGG